MDTLLTIKLLLSLAEGDMEIACSMVQSEEDAFEIIWIAGLCSHARFWNETPWTFYSDFLGELKARFPIDQLRKCDDALTPIAMDLIDVCMGLTVEEIIRDYE